MIKDLIIYIYTTKFELEQEQLELIKEYLPASELAILEEERAPLQLEVDFEPVSDNEDGIGNIQPETQERPGKRQCIGTGNEGQRKEQHVQQTCKLDDEIEHLLPQNKILARGTKRACKAPRGFEDYKIMKP